MVDWSCAAYHFVYIACCHGVRVDKAFRGVREMTKEEIEEINRESRRSRRQQLRTEKMNKLREEKMIADVKGGSKTNAAGITMSI